MGKRAQEVPAPTSCCKLDQEPVVIDQVIESKSYLNYLQYTVDLQSPSIACFVTSN